MLVSEWKSMEKVIKWETEQKMFMRFCPGVRLLTNEHHESDLWVWIVMSITLSLTHL
jgi:hypothetical protein